jgi:hypothetical protein
MPTEGVATGVEHENQIFTPSGQLVRDGHACSADCDALNTVASELRALVDIPFRYGVAKDLAQNLLTAQSLASYASPESLELSIESVVRAIGIDELTFHSGFVGFADVDPITWLSSTIAIDPGATIVITPDALDFGEVPVATPEPAGWILMLMGLTAFTLWRRGFARVRCGTL